MEEIDEAFNTWWREKQPLQVIARAPKGYYRLTSDQYQVMQQEIRKAFIDGYTQGWTAHAALPIPEDPERGPVR